MGFGGALLRRLRDGQPEGKVVAGKMPALHKAGGARFTTAALPSEKGDGNQSLDFVSAVSFLSCL